MAWYDSIGNAVGKVVDGYTQLELAKIGGGVQPLPADNGAQNTYRPETIPDQGATQISNPTGPAPKVGERIVFAGLEFDKQILTLTAMLVGGIWVFKKVA